MNPGNEIVKELEELSSLLAGMPRIMPFSVPDGYFDAFPDIIAETLRYEEDQPLNLPGAMPYTVPQGYFDGLAAAVMAQISETPAFGRAGNAAFEVPAGYFEQLPQQMLNVAKAAGAPEKKQTRTISFFPQKAIRWAAAAGILLAIGFGGYKMMNSPAPRISAQQQLAQLDKKVISSYVQQHLDEFDTEMLAEGSPVLNQKPERNINKLDETAIRQYLDEEGI